MTKTFISSDKQEVIIGFDAPFCVIGERINPTGRKLLAAEMAAGDYSRVLSDAVAQVEAGATMLDVNAGIRIGHDVGLLGPFGRCAAWLVAGCRSVRRCVGLQFLQIFFQLFQLCCRR